MSDHAAPGTPQPAEKFSIETTLDEAVVAYSVACRDAHAVRTGNEPLLVPYLAGWGCRDMGMKDPGLAKLGAFASSWRRGWEDCDRYLRHKSAHRGGST